MERNREKQQNEKDQKSFKKMRDIKGTFHVRISMIKDRNIKGSTEAEDTNKRWQEYTELQKKNLNDLENHNGVICHLEPDILECEVTWALGSIIMNKASGGDEIPAELFQTLKDDAIKVLHSIFMQIWKTQQWPQWTGKGQFSFQCQRMFKLLHSCTYLTHQRIMFKIFQKKASTVHGPRTSRCSSQIQKRQRNQRSSCQHPLDHTKSKRTPEKQLLCFFDYTKSFDYVDPNRLENSQRLKYQTILPAS